MTSEPDAQVVLLRPRALRIPAPFVLALLLAGCQEGGTRSPRGPRARPARPVMERSPATPPEPGARVRPDEVAARPQESTEPPPSPPPSAPQATGHDEANASSRRLAAWLQQQVPACLQGRLEPSAPSLRVAAKAYVSATGRVTRAQVTGLPPEAARCVARRLEAARLPPPPDAPARVSAEARFVTKSQP